MLLDSATVLPTAATVSFRALEVLTSPLSLPLSLSGCTAPGTGTAEPKEIVILHTAKCKMKSVA